MFERGEQITKELQVQFHIKSAVATDTYRVKNEVGELFFLKLFHRDRLDDADFVDGGKLREIELLESLRHPAITRYVDAGQLDTQDGAKEYLLTGFISGETIHERMRRILSFEPDDARRLVMRILQGLDHLHGQSDPVSHNEVTNQNVMLDLGSGVPESVLIDFGQARRKSESPFVPGVGHDPYYLAPECFEAGSGAASDVFAAGALYYHMLFGIPPWYLNVSQYQARYSDIRDALAKERRSKLKYPQLQSGLPIDSRDLRALEQSLSLSPARRFSTAGEFLAALDEQTTPMSIPAEALIAPTARVYPARQLRRLKRGFDAVAGMDDLKALLMRDVVKALKDREGYESYGIPIPNGMLLYGPPGCGKTFLAEKFAEEVGINFRSIKPSDLASIYVHGTQEKIGELFREARENAPTILFFDELDALLPSRDNVLGHSYASEVNEFLVQMGSCSRDGVFMVGATNRPDLIDPAVLRTGRMDKIIYIPPPDMEARRVMFQLHVEGRPATGDIDCVALAGETDKRVASDIEFLVNEAARDAYDEKSSITQVHLLRAIRNSRPSVSERELEKYAEMKRKLESGGAEPPRRAIGFHAAVRS